MENQSRVSAASAVVSVWPVGSAKPGCVLLFGAPGVGKGTQAREMERLWRVPHISTGDVLRAHVLQGTPAVRTAQEVMARGELVPDLLVCQILATRLQAPDTFDGFILDGFPRTLEQAVWLDECLASQGFGSSIIAISMRMDPKQLIRRVIGRRTCPVCNASYNLHANPPKLEGRCDIDLAQLEQRSDDTEEILLERLRAYELRTEPVIKHYRVCGRVLDVDGDRPIEEIAAEIASAVDLIRR